MAKTQFVADLREGSRFDEIFMVKGAKLGETRAGKPYLVITVMDKSGEVSGPVWENAVQLHQICGVGELVHLTGSVQTYREQVQLRIDTMEAVNKNGVDLGDFLPSSPKCRQQMADELQAIARSVTNPYIKKLLLYFFKKSDWWQKFQEAPAAKGVHHAYIGGLLEHTLSLARVVDLLSGHYEGVDRSLLLAGALLHDIGKIEELYMEGGAVDYTVRGRLKGHLVMGSEMVGKAAAKIKDFPPELVEQIQHLILSHHGKKEFGSPIVPMTVEAFLLTFLDDLDAKMSIIEQLRKKMDSEQYSWTEYQRILERYLYLRGFEEEKGKETSSPEQGENTNRQPTLF